ncbi:MULTISPECIES: ribonuclease III [unclassified Adlercreutzia]|uniref:ribonuclease III n=1 Tax=unclassified Adlercreutzia TaxID=2636013 RepID=UPI0013EA449F|nr:MULTISPECIES: ribonuclease III [unclassified Adlercreutzia]
MSLSPEQERKLARAEEILGYHFEQEQLILSAITHPSATEGKAVKYSYERLEFLGDSILGAIVASTAFHRFHELDEGGLTRIKVALVSGASLSDVAEKLGFTDVIVFGSSETGTGRRGLHSALENVYEAIVAALYLDGGIGAAEEFVRRTLIPRMTLDMASEPENPKSALQEKLQEDGITPTYKLVETQGPPHDRTFVAQVYAGEKGLARGTGRTKKEAESQAAKSTLARLSEFFGIGMTGKERAQKEAAAKRAKASKAAEKAEREAAAMQAKADKAAARAEEKRAALEEHDAQGAGQAYQE